MRLLSLIFAGLIATGVHAQDTSTLTKTMLEAMKEAGVQIRLPDCRVKPCSLRPLPKRITVHRFMQADQLSLAGQTFNRFPQFVFGMEKLKYLDIRGTTFDHNDNARLRLLQGLEEIVFDQDIVANRFPEGLGRLKNLKAVTHGGARREEQGAFVGWAQSYPAFFRNLESLKMYWRSPEFDAVCGHTIPFADFKNLKTLQITIVLEDRYNDIFALPQLTAFKGPDCGANSTIIARIKN